MKISHKNRAKAYINILSMIEKEYKNGRLGDKEYKKACKKLRKHFKKHHSE